jgi:hypothetical protein
MNDFDTKEFEINPLTILNNSYTEYTSQALKNLGIEKEKLNITIKSKDFYNIKESPYLHMQRFVS